LDGPAWSFCRVALAQDLGQQLFFAAPSLAFGHAAFFAHAHLSHLQSAFLTCAVHPHDSHLHAAFFSFEHVAGHCATATEAIIAAARAIIVTIRFMCHLPLL
jgi:hypothetical protein